MLKFSVIFKPGLPIYEQVVYAAKKAIVSSQLKPGDRFPSVREISRELKINPNTVQKVMNQLVHEQLILIKPGIGSVVAEPSVASIEQKNNILGAEIERLVVEAKRLSIPMKDVVDALKCQWERNHAHT